MELRARLDKIKTIIEQDSFFNQQSLGGELNFHIFDYEPSYIYYYIIYRQ